MSWVLPVVYRYDVFQGLSVDDFVFHSVMLYLWSIDIEVPRCAPIIWATQDKQQ